MVWTVDYVLRDLLKHIRILECKNKMMHSMLNGDTEVVCNLHPNDNLDFHHKYNVTKLEDTKFKISWKK